MKEVKHSGIVLMQVSGSMISKVFIKVIESAGVVVVPSSVHDIETFARMRMEESQLILGLSWNCCLSRVSRGKHHDENEEPVRQE
jgi:hypothetical protein